jgi:hypothetical protein
MKCGLKCDGSPVPVATADCLRVLFFLSFLGLIVSVLGFALSVPFPL